MMKSMIHFVCVILAFISLFLGCLGVVLPILPTTPFLFLALILFARGSERFHKWFLSTRLYKKYLEDFIVERAMTKTAKIRVLIVVTFLFALGFYFSPVFAKIIIAIIAIFHYAYFLLGIKTIADKTSDGDCESISSKQSAEKGSSHDKKASDRPCG